MRLSYRLRWPPYLFWWAWVVTPWRRLVVWTDRLRGLSWSRCPGCGAFEEEMQDPCDACPSRCHHPITVNRYGSVTTP